MVWLLDPIGTLFADTSGLFALAVQRDQHHTAAHELQRSFVQAKTQLVTTNFVVAELHALMLTRVGTNEANALLVALDQSRMLIVRAEAADELHARSIVSRYGDHGYSLTDAISFAVMDRLHIDRAFTFDQHFARYGISIPSAR